MSKTTTTRWTCPTCGREFARTAQSHSCQVRSVDDHLLGKPPAVQRAFAKLVSQLRALGPLRVDAVKTTIHLFSTFGFGGLTVKRDHVRVSFLSDTPIVSDRIVSRERLGAERLAYAVQVQSPRDVDAQLLQWLTRAYHLQAR